MKLKVFSCIALVIGSLFVLHAQQDNLEDIIYLSDGSVLRGQLQVTAEGEPFAVAILGGSVLRIDPAEIDSMGKVERFNLNQLRPIRTKQQGLFNITSGGWMMGSRNAGSWGTGESIGAVLHNTTGYYFHPALGVGVGVGIDNYSGVFALTSPVYLHLEGMPWEGSIVPYYVVQGGYGFAWSTDQNTEWYRREEQGGWYWLAGIGLRFFTRNRAFYNLQVGIRQQERMLEEWYTWNESYQRYDITHTRLQVTFGIGF